jgi:3-hydroxyisobutyrate dehydrogenase-like beta-hydroxyacid dehydrogenase
MNIGFVGIGKMGSRMANRLLEAGHNLTVNDINPGAARPFLERGVKWADTPKAVAAACPLVITMLPGPPQIEQVVYSTEGLMAGWKKGDIYIDMSTSLPGTTRKVAADALKLGVDMLDAPVTGGAPWAETGTLTIMVGGAPEVYQKVVGILGHMGKKVLHMGDSGCGNITKLVNNLISLTCTLVNAEAFVIGVKAGVDTRKLFDAVTAGSGNNFQLQEVWSRTILTGNFEPEFELGLAAKDVSLAMALAREYQIPLPISASVEQCYIEGKAAGLSKEALGTHIWRLEELANVKVRFNQ